MSHEYKLHALIMAGGQGTRFWPESTAKKPKQYLPLLEGRPLLTETLERFDGLVSLEDRYIVTVEEQEHLVKECSKGLINSEHIIYEPSGRNTAPCILLALSKLLEEGAKEDDIVSVVPSDHVILNKNGFRGTIAKASKLAHEQGLIVTIGIIPNFPNTGFGYIQKGDSIEDGKFKVSKFVEKPNFETAKKYLESGEYLWNAGMFVAPIKVFLDEFKKCSPETFEFFNKLRENLNDKKALGGVYSEIPKDSIDYAVMEKSQRVAVVPAEFDWNDLGSWDALESVLEQEDGNTVVDAKGHFFKNSSGNIVYTPGKFISLINVEDLIVVSNDKAVVVLPKKDSQEVKKIVEHLKANALGDDLL